MSHVDDEKRREETFNLEQEAVFEGLRTVGAAQVVLVRARVFGCPLKLDDGPVRPFLTAANTLGFVNVLRGTAWDTDVVANEGVSHLGFLKIRHSTFAPKGWQALDVPGWRGYGGTPDNRRVPSSEIRRDAWIQPRLVKTGLRTLDEIRGTDEGKYLLNIGPDMAGIWPWGLPPWLKGTSATNLDCALLAMDLKPTAIARGSDALEFDRASVFLHFVHQTLSEDHCEKIDPAWAYMARNEPCTAIECATALATMEKVAPSYIQEIVHACIRVCESCAQRVATNTGLCLACRKRSPNDNPQFSSTAAPRSRRWPPGDFRKVH